jgi:hypothetical protein
MTMGRRTGGRAVAATAAALVSLVAGPVSPGRAQPLSSQPVLGVPASQFEVIGSSEGEAAGEAWAQGSIGAVPVNLGGTSVSGAEVLLRYSNAAPGWQVVPVDDASGNPIQFTWQASEVTHGGGIVLTGTDGTNESVVTRDPGGAFSLAPPPPTGADGLHAGESLYPNSNIPAVAAIDESGRVGALIAPDSEDAPAPGVLHYLSGTWTREPLCAEFAAAKCKPPKGQLTVDAVAASAPGNAWLIATVNSGSGPKAPLLFQRQSAGPGAPVWIEVHPQSWMFGAGAPPQAGETASPIGTGPVLTASGQGVWVDMQIRGSGQGGDASVFVSPAATGALAGSWCFPVTLCPGAGSLGAALPASYGSFAWPGSGPTDPGPRVVSGLANAALLERSDGDAGFSYETTSGDAPGAPGGGGTFGPGGETLTTTATQQEGGAALATPTEGWLGSALTPPHETPKVVHLTASLAGSALTVWPVPFGSPLLAVTGAPGAAPASATAQTLAVGVGGEIARYAPGQGWAPEFLYNSAGVRQTPTLRGVAWPEPGRAYAVGDNGAMWLWRAETGLWEPDPAKPLNFHGNLNSVAFSPNDPSLGYAVGKQGVLLAYGKTWTQQAVPDAVAQAHFTSITFAGSEALVAYRMLTAGGGAEQGGVIVNNGSGWQVDPGVQALLAQLPPGQTTITKVAGLPDGGAVAAGPGLVLERDSATSSWRFSAVPLADSANGNISALAAVRDGASVRALVSVDDDPQSDPSGLDNLLWQNIDNPPAPSPGQPPLLIGPDPIPSHGFLMQETATGWVDEQHQDYPNLLSLGAGNGDLPGWPDPVLALLVDPTGAHGWAVGGQTGGDELQVNGAPGAAAVVQTANVARLGGDLSPPTNASAPVALPQGQASFAFGGGSGCAQACADLAAQQPGPDVWLKSAVASAAGIHGLRAFIYGGQRIGDNAQLDASSFERELADYAGLLSSSSLPVYAAATSNDVGAAIGGAAGFAQALGPHVPAGSSPAGSPSPPPGTAAYAFDSPGPEGTVRVIVLDYSANSISGGGGAQLQWLAGQLDSARAGGTPAIVVGGDDITDSNAPNAAADGAAVGQVLLAHGASAYLFYDANEQNVSEPIGSGQNKIPAFGSGTLGYVRPPTNEADAAAFLGASGFLLVSVDDAHRDPATNRAPVSANLVPNTGALAIDAADGTLLRRSEVALFEGLARRPVGGSEWLGGAPGSEAMAPQPFTVLPETCLGAACGQFVKPQYVFSSSNPKIADFVAHDPNSTNPRQILQDSSGRPIPDATSGLLCAYNAGTTAVTISSGGLSYSEPVTVQAGSIQEPCGTTPVTPPPPPAPTPSPSPPSPAPSPAPVVPVPVKIPVPPPPAAKPVPPPPPPRPPLPPPPPPHARTAPLPLPPAAIAAVAAPAVVPPKVLLPVPGIAARPTPPTGFSSVPVTSALTARVVEEERQEEEAVERARSQFSAYHPDDGGNFVPGIALVIVVLAAAVAGAGLRGRPRRRGAAALARAELRRPRRF